MSFPRSDHCNGKTFFYPGGDEHPGLLDLLRWKFGSKPAAWPRWIELALQPPPQVPRDGEVVITWINHATFLIQTSQGNFLTDPVFSQRCSPVSWAGPQRVHAPGIAFEALPKIDAVLLSHDHYDHCDFPSLRKLAATHRPRIIAPLGHAALLAGIGIKDVVELDWWQTHEWSSDLTITLTPSRHWCRRRIGGTNLRLWGGFFLKTAAHRLHFVGDSGYDPVLFPKIRERLGPSDLAFIPIGAYEPRWFMKPAHMNPAEAVQTHQDLQARQSIAMHWGTFQLTDEAREDPPTALVQALSEAHLPPDTIQVMAPGQSRLL